MISYLFNYLKPMLTYDYRKNLSTLVLNSFVSYGPIYTNVNRGYFKIPNTSLYL